MQPILLAFIVEDFLDADPVEFLYLLFMDMLLESIQIILMRFLSLLHLFVEVIRIPGDQRSEITLVLEMFVLDFVLMSL